MSQDYPWGSPLPPPHHSGAKMSSISYMFCFLLLSTRGLYKSTFIKPGTGGFHSIG